MHRLTGECRTDEVGNNVDQLSKGCCEHKDSAVPRRELDATNGKFGEEDYAITEDRWQPQGLVLRLLH